MTSMMHLEECISSIECVATPETSIALKHWKMHPASWRCISTAMHQRHRYISGINSMSQKSASSIWTASNQGRIAILSWVSSSSRSLWCDGSMSSHQEGAYICLPCVRDIQTSIVCLAHVHHHPKRWHAAPLRDNSDWPSTIRWRQPYCDHQRHDRQNNDFWTISVLKSSQHGPLFEDRDKGGSNLQKLEGRVKILNFQGPLKLTPCYRDSIKIHQFGCQKSKSSRANFRGESPPSSFRYVLTPPSWSANF